MKNLLSIALATVLLLTGCGGEDANTDPNAPVAKQPGTANGWTADQTAIASERCAAYGLMNASGTRLNNWLSFCGCGYSAIAQSCDYSQFQQYSSWCIQQQSSAVSSCLQSAGLSSGGGTQALDKR